MEQHPVPRNITGFQFHLIGDMTLKQFGELLAGVILGYIAIKLPFPTFISWPLGTMFALLGVAFAFLPIQERPLDRWLIAFLRSIYSPTQFLWQKGNEPPSILLPTARAQKVDLAPAHVSQMEESRQKLQAYLTTLPKRPHETIDRHETEQLQRMTALFGAKATRGESQLQPVSASPTPIPQAPPPKPPTPPPQKVVASNPPATPVSTAVSLPPKQPEHQQPKQPELPPLIETPQQQTPLQEAKIVTEAIEKVEEQLAKNHIPKERYFELEKKLIELNTERERLTSELVALKRSLLEGENLPKPPAEAAKLTTPPTSQGTAAPRQTTPAPSFMQIPNIITGTVKDRQGNLLPNIIITIKDKNGVPQRALKSNRLGQFATTTPLTNGAYVVELEDPQKIYFFDTIELSLTNSVIPPLEAIAKTQKEINRDKLMKEVFGKTF